MVTGSFCLILLLIVCCITACAQSGSPTPMLAGRMIPLSENCAYSWFSDPRAVIHDGKLIVGSVHAVDTFRGGQDDPNWGTIEIAVCDLASGQVRTAPLHRHFEQDDHDDPSFLLLPDNQLLAFYSKHGVERKAYARRSEANDPLRWSDATIIETPGKDAAAFRGDNVTYSNPFLFPNGRIYNFYRGFDYDPNYMYSDDNGATWSYGGRLFKGKDGYGPYVKYAYDGEGTVHFVATEDHPRNFDNSLYHGIIRDGRICGSDGKSLAPLSASTQPGIQAWELTRLFQGDADNVAWMCDIKLDPHKRPHVLFTVQKDGANLPKGEGGFDHRFDYASWDGNKWSVREIAHAGTRLYRGEDDYTGLGAIDPGKPHALIISTDADPATGSPLVSAVDHQRHHELFRGTSDDSGSNWKWEPITANSVMENLRPIALRWNHRLVVVWMRGHYFNNRGQWDTTVCAMVL